MMFRAMFVGSNKEMRKNLTDLAQNYEIGVRADSVLFGDTMVSFSKIDKETFFSFMKEAVKSVGETIRYYTYVDGNSWWDAKYENFLGKKVWNSNFDLENRENLVLEDLNFNKEN